MSDLERGESIKRRRLALGIANPNQFYLAMREDFVARGRKPIDRETLTKAERGTASSSKMDEIEAWLEFQEKENGMDDAPTGIRLTFHNLRSGVVTVDDLIIDGPVDHPEQLAEAVGKILERFNNGEN